MNLDPEAEAMGLKPPERQGPLSGLVVLDLTRVLAGPYCTLILSDLGAEVIKVEQPGDGDESRTFFPFIEGESAYFASVNRGKKSIALDLKDPADLVVFDQLLARADVLVENFRPGVLQKLGYGWESLKATHPRLVVASISGFGQTGPYKDRGAYDLIVQAMSGIMSVTGFPDMPPARVGTSIGDLAAGVFAAVGVQSALLQRQRTGAGCQVDVSMLECQLALLENALSRYESSGTAPGPVGARHPTATPFDAFKARDKYLVITAGRNPLFQRLAKVLGKPELATDPRFADAKSRLQNEADLKLEIEALLQADNRDEWLAKLGAAGVPAGPVNDIAEITQDPQIVFRGILSELKRSNGLKLPFTPVLLSTLGYPQTLEAAPKLDEHREELLSRLGGVAQDTTPGFPGR